MSKNPNSVYQNPDFLKQKEVAAILRKSVAWCERARWEGGGPPFIKVGRNVLYPRDDLMEWLQAHELFTSTTKP